MINLFRVFVLVEIGLITGKGTEVHTRVDVRGQEEHVCTFLEV